MVEVKHVAPDGKLCDDVRLNEVAGQGGWDGKGTNHRGGIDLLHLKVGLAAVECLDRAGEDRFDVVVVRNRHRDVRGGWVRAGMRQAQGMFRSMQCYEYACCAMHLMRYTLKNSLLQEDLIASTLSI